jgi:hypothetical protein
METADKLVTNCVALLEQGAGILSLVDDQLYTSISPVSPHGSIGAHIRHILDFYTNFLSGLKNGIIDYNVRDRTSLVQSNRRKAIAVIERTINEFTSITILDPQGTLYVSTEEDGFAATVQIGSSFLRELDFLQSHTIHHYSVIALLLRLHNIEPGQEFGVAPSTLAFNRESACAR